MLFDVEGGQEAHLSVVYTRTLTHERCTWLELATKLEQPRCGKVCWMVNAQVVGVKLIYDTVLVVYSAVGNGLVFFSLRWLLVYPTHNDLLHPQQFLEIYAHETAPAHHGGQSKRPHAHFSC